MGGDEPPVEPTHRYGPPYPPAGPVWPPATTQRWALPAQMPPPEAERFPGPPSGPPAGPWFPAGPPAPPGQPVIPAQPGQPPHMHLGGYAGYPVGWPSQPPAGPWTGYGPYWPPPPPEPPRRGTLGWAIAGLVLVVLVALAGLVFVRAVRNTGDTSAWSGQASGSPPSVTDAPSDPAAAATAGAITNSDAIADKVDPAIVDVNVTLRQGRAAGTGIVLSANGLVLTNNHVIDGGQTITAVDYGNGRTYQADVLGYDRSRDLALLQLLDASKLTAATIGDSTKVKVGDKVVALGNAGGRGGKPAVAPGEVTALDRTITASDENGTNAERLTGLIQIAAAIEAGDSGGPLVDSAARVIGIDTAAAADAKAQANGGIGFAIPINQAMTVAHQIQTRTGPATVHTGPTAFLGVQLGTADTDSNDVAAVVAGSPAAAAGIRKGDQVVSVDGASIASSSDLADALVPHHPKDQVTVTWKNANGSHSLKVTLDQGPPL